MSGLIQSDLVGEGLVLWSPKAAMRRESCTRELTALLEAEGFERTYTPYIVQYSLYEQQKEKLKLPAVWTRSRHSLEEKEEAERQDDYCFGANKVLSHMKIVESMFKSYRDLPICLYEFCEIYEQGPPISNYFGVTLSAFGTEGISLLLLICKMAEITSKHGFVGEGVTREAITDDEYSCADNHKEKITVSYIDLKFGGKS